MMTKEMLLEDHYIDDYVDDHVDREIESCFSASSPNNFFVFAGAGSGKTRSLINTLNFLDKEQGEKLLMKGKQIAVITYTNAACDEISRRLQYKSIFSVSTIHSFLWELIKNYQVDIKTWIMESVQKEIEELKQKQTKTSRGKAGEKRAETIKKKTERLAKIRSIQKFSYNPNGDNVGYDSLSHSEVIKMSTEFIATEPTMQDILTSKYPILLIDESQDTKKELIDALLIVCEKYGEKFIVGMFGDTMQKIYNDGKDNLAKCIPDNWVKPVKIMNHRSAKRIVTLANSIRSSVDDQKQQARSDAEEGTVRLFITSKSNNKEYVEKRVAEMMVQDTGDIGWNDEEDYKSLILEHHMAASRFGFSELYMPLSNSKKFDTSLREGSIPELSILSKLVFPLLVAYQSGNDFEVAKIIRKNSPLLNKEVFITGLNNQVELLRKAEEAVELLMKLWNDGKVPTCLEVLKSIRDTGLFKVGNRVDEVLADYSQDENEKITALRTALSAPFYELERYALYVSDNTRFATHQGVKGLEFPRVMVILDDAQARGFLFSYEKLFGVKAQSDTDEKNAHDGKDTSITRTARLFYVACTRAKKSLAIVAYTENEEMVRDTALANGWFLENEIYIV
ncbi:MULTISPECIES: UvrD-helicase domain-containing protein [Dorea]|jgi:DNA helicase-2/ATP-dependent DNA helicase PcrA|uniref:DNA 3'-5' helicase n=1 Tax=Dorea longicatena TaxID=88431 RepID=A0A3E5G8Y0_9FIRM|nr:UvrD-helicase domain-containing protein [Dorea longicatena]MBS6172309.1 ATP-dependent helicase [Clostridiales bacterium]RGO30595.1 ATP-dependent helicase [Dorea longicatena]